MKVYVGISGGVDSAVSAALLKERGHSVTGVFIKIWQPEFIECTWREDRLDAMRVAATLGIPYQEVDLSEQYKKAVVQDMIATYMRGETPNPDVLCNREIKFGEFFRWAMRDGAEAVATGHYARTHDGVLLRGVDSEKDQSYFLHRIGKAQLENTFFPVGSLHKQDVRALAHRFGLPVATKRDSQGLCFVGDITLPEFLARYVALQKGVVRDEAGKVIGEHDGAQLYTAGQRHGFRVFGGESAPRYVIATDTAKNEIMVSAERAHAAHRVAYVVDMHWIEEPTLPGECDIQTRYREQPLRARVEENNTGVVVHFHESHLLSQGQSLVIYDGQRCIGGGPIARIA